VIQRERLVVCQSQPHQVQQRRFCWEPQRSGNLGVLLFLKNKHFAALLHSSRLDFAEEAVQGPEGLLDPSVPNLRRAAAAALQDSGLSKPAQGFADCVPADLVLRGEFQLTRESAGVRPGSEVPLQVIDQLRPQG